MIVTAKCTNVVSPLLSSLVTLCSTLQTPEGFVISLLLDVLSPTLSSPSVLTWFVVWVVLVDTSVGGAVEVLVPTVADAIELVPAAFISGPLSKAASSVHSISMPTSASLWTDGELGGLTFTDVDGSNLLWAKTFCLCLLGVICGEAGWVLFPLLCTQSTIRMLLKQSHMDTCMLVNSR